MLLSPRADLVLVVEMGIRKAIGFGIAAIAAGLAVLNAYRALKRASRAAKRTTEK